MPYKKTPPLTLEEARKHFSYCERTGLFTRLTGCHAGSLCLTFLTNGHIVMRVGRQTYSASKIAWLMHYGEYPIRSVRHKDGDGGNNRMNNLALSTGIRKDGN